MLIPLEVQSIDIVILPIGLLTLLLMFLLILCYVNQNCSMLQSIDILILLTLLLISLFS